MRQMFNTRLLKPLDYIKIKASQKRAYDLWYPLGTGTAITFIIYILPFKITIFGSSGLIELIIEILQILTGFYIASLAAVATFHKPDMDKPMAGTAPKLKELVRGVEVISSLTRRRFLSYLFGYLAFICIFLYFLGGSANLIAPGIIKFIPVYLLAPVKWFFLWFYLVVTSNMIVTTLIGLFYMCDRIHRE